MHDVQNNTSQCGSYNSIIRKNIKLYQFVKLGYQSF